MNEQSNHKFVPMPEVTQNLDISKHDDVTTMMSSLLLFFIEAIGLTNMIVELQKEDEPSSQDLFNYFASMIRNHVMAIGAGMFHHALESDLVKDLVPTELKDLQEDGKIQKMLTDPQAPRVLQQIFQIGIGNILHEQRKPHEVMTAILGDSDSK